MLMDMGVRGCLGLELLAAVPGIPWFLLGGEHLARKKEAAIAAL